VSTDHQTHDAQRDALEALGVSRIFADKMSGARDDRTGYRALLDYVRPGDTIVVTALDRLGRSLTSIVNTVGDLGQRGIYVRTPFPLPGCGTHGEQAACAAAVLGDERFSVIRLAAAVTCPRARRTRPGGRSHTFTAAFRSSASSASKVAALPRHHRRRGIVNAA